MAGVMKFGHFVSTPPLSIKVWRPAGEVLSRFGVVVPAKKVRRAVDRNLLKRRGRAVLASLYPQLIPGTWVALFLDKTQLTSDFAEFTTNIKALAAKAKLIN